MRGIRQFYLKYNLWYSKRKLLVTLVLVSTLLLLFHYILPSRQYIQDVSIPKFKEHKSRSWYKVFDSTYIYSAFWDERDVPHVKIITVSPYDERLADIHCFVKIEGEIIRTDTIFHIMDFENNGVEHTPLFFLCYPKDQKRPTQVALSIPDGELSVWLPVQTMFPERNISNKLALCVRPLFVNHKDYNVRIVEFIAYYQLLGVSHFVFYDYKVDPSTKRLLQQLSYNGVSLQLLPWDIPSAVEHSWQNGQIASITDCVYRLASGYEFVLVVDLDEFIVPRFNVTLQNIIHSFTSASSQPSASYIFRQSFFCLDSKDDSNGKNIPLPLVTQTKYLRKDVISPWNSRAKSIVRPLAVILPGIHKVLLTYGKWQSIVFVEPRIALVHHYRNDMCSFLEKFGYGAVEDIAAFKYRNDLLNSLPVKIYLKLYGSQ